MKLNMENIAYEAGQSYMNNMKDSKAKLYFAIPLFVIMSIELDPGKSMGSCSILEINKLLSKPYTCSAVKPANLMYVFHASRYSVTCPDDHMRAHSARMKRATSTLVQLLRLQGNYNTHNPTQTCFKWRKITI